MRNRLFVGATAIAAAMAVGVAAPASAYECYNAVRSAQGNQSAAGSAALMSFEEILTDPEVVGLCPQGAEYVIEGLEEEGYRTDVLISFRALMARGLEETHPEKLHDGKGIDHLSEDFFAVVDPLIGEAFGMCGP